MNIPNNIQNNIQFIMTETVQTLVPVIMDDFYMSSSDEEEDDYDMKLCMMMDYENFTIKQLTRISDYYKLKNPKNVKKIDIIIRISQFETDDSNESIVLKRKQMWFYMSELKTDSFMSQFIFWG